MEVPTITMTPEAAQFKLDAWLAEKHADQAEVRGDMIKGYEALAEGKTLLDLGAAMRAAGQRESGFPKLAIARADRDEVHFSWHGHETAIIFDAAARHRHWSRRGPTSRSLTVRIEMQKRHGVVHTHNSTPRWLEGFAQVPILPADHRPATGQLRDWFILWEVERWAARSMHAQPDRDPILLEPICGQLYAVLAQWDLTDLELAVMSGALRAEA